MTPSIIAEYCCAECYLCWVLFMLSFIYAKFHLWWVPLCWVSLCWVLFMLSVIYAECHLCWVSFMLSFINAECYLWWVSLMLSLIYTECNLCWMSFIPSVIYADILQINYTNIFTVQKLTGKKSKSSLDQAFNFKLGCFCYKRHCMKHTTTHTS